MLLKPSSHRVATLSAAEQAREAAKRASQDFEASKKALAKAQKEFDDKPSLSSAAALDRARKTHATNARRRAQARSEDARHHRYGYEALPHEVDARQSADGARKAFQAAPP